MDFADQHNRGLFPITGVGWRSLLFQKNSVDFFFKFIVFLKIKLQ